MSRRPAFPIGCRGKRARFISLRYALKIENAFLLNLEHGKFAAQSSTGSIDGKSSSPSPCPITYIFSLHPWIGTLPSVILRNGLNEACRLPSKPMTWCWQEGCFDRLLRSEESLSEKWEYLRQNPVRAGLVVDRDDWPYQFQFNEGEL